MRVFVTGATGFIGSAIVPELLAAGHQVLGLARSDAAANALAAAGATPHHGDLEDLDSLRAGAAASDGVVHAGFIHDFARFADVCETDRRAIEAIGSALAGSNRPLIVTSGVGLLAQDALATEADTPPADSPVPRIASEQAADAVAATGVRVSVLRLPPSVHGEGDRGFVPMLIGTAREKGLSAYVGEGQNFWSAVHRLDAARLFRLALEKAAPGGARYHGVAEEGISFRAIAEAIGERLGVPVASLSGEEAKAHFGGFFHFAIMKARASAAQTRAALEWHPAHFGLLADMDNDYYFRPSSH